jgi:hypothetical protein
MSNFQLLRRQPTHLTITLLDSGLRCFDSPPAFILAAPIVVSLRKKKELPTRMTQLEVAYRYATAPREAEMRALDSVREVYGIRRIKFDPKERIVRVEFDASRFKEPVIAGLLRQAGLNVQEKLVLA